MEEMYIHTHINMPPIARCGYQQSNRLLLRLLSVFVTLSHSCYFHPVKRSSEVIPALLGPVLLIVTAMHVFVYAGIAIWGGEVVVGIRPDLTPFYGTSSGLELSNTACVIFAV